MVRFTAFKSFNFCRGLFSAASRPASQGETIMDALVNLIIQIVAGAIGGNGIGAALKDVNLGALGNTVAGGIGGAAGGQLLQLLIPALTGAAGGGLDVGALLGQVVGGGVSGAVLTAIVGAIKTMMAGQPAR
jgi:hypothetical protein